MTSTVGAVTAIGPRDVNEDRSFTARCPDDGSWVIAVADGLSGHPQGDTAATAAVADLPQRIASTEVTQQVFEDAHEEVASPAPWPGASKGAPQLCPMATLCVAAWTPDSGPIVGQMGDTLTVLVRWTDTATEGYLLGETLHHSQPGIMNSYLGYGVTLRDRGYAGLGVVTSDPPPDRWATVIISDGVWEPLLGGRRRARTAPITPLGARVGATCGPAAGPASRIADRVLQAASDVGLDDNATVAAAHMAPNISGASR